MEFVLKLASTSIVSKPEFGLFLRPSSGGSGGGGRGGCCFGPGARTT